METKLKRLFKYSSVSVDRNILNNQILIIRSYRLEIGIFINDTMYILEKFDRTMTTQKHIDKLIDFSKNNCPKYCILENFLFYQVLRFTGGYGGYYGARFTLDMFVDKERLQIKIAKRLSCEIDQAKATINHIENYLNIRNEEMKTYKQNLEILQDCLEDYINGDSSFTEIKDALLLYEKLN